MDRNGFVLIVVGLLCTVALVASAQSIPSGRTTGPNQSVPSEPSDQSTAPSSPSLLLPLKLPIPDAAYRPITRQERLRWFVTSTIGPAHLAGAVFASAFGTALDRPKEYGSHWGGFADRYGMSISGSAIGNAIEAGVGLVIREDPRYFRVPNRPVKARVGNAVRLTFVARHDDGSFGPAYARSVAIFGSNFLSNTWRVHSEANVPDALLRSAEGFAGRMAGNAFKEFWPDVKKRVFQSSIHRTRPRGKH